MLKNSKTPIIIGTSIPILGYLMWLLFFNHHYPHLRELKDKDAILNFVFTTSALIACLSLLVHIGFCLLYTKKLANALIEIQSLNEAAEEMALRTDKTAIEIQRLDKQIKTFFAKDKNPKERSKLVRKWESAYFFRSS